MIWERLIKWKDETIDVLNKHLVEYDEPGMERFNKKELGWVAKTSLNEALENTTNWYLKVFEKDAYYGLEIYFHYLEIF